MCLFYAQVFHDADVNYSHSSVCGSTHTLHGHDFAVFHALDLWEELIHNREISRPKIEFAAIAGHIVDMFSTENW